MKLVIEIPDNFKDYIEDVLMGVGDSTEILVDAVMDGTPLDKVIEDIKQDIEQKIPKVGYDIGAGLAIASNIINDHIRKEQE